MLMSFPARAKVAATAVILAVAATILPGQPVLGSIDPVAAPAGSPGITLVVDGTGFNATSVVRWNGQNLTTTALSSTRLLGVVLASRLASAGSATITVFGPGGTSAGTGFTITPGGSITLGSVAPGSVTAGSVVATLTLTGANFGTAPVARFTVGATTTDLLTLASSSTTLQALVPGPLLATAASATITVRHGATGALSNGVAFAVVTNPVPSITSLLPASLDEGSPGQALRVLGANFGPGSVVEIDGVPQATSFVGSSEVQATLTAAHLDTVGTRAIVVRNPAPGGGPSLAATFTVTARLPVLSSIQPTSLVGGVLPPAALALVGSGFNSLSQARLNGSALATTFVSPTRLDAVVPSAALLVAGPAAITVVNAAPGGGTSAPATLTITNPVPALVSLSPLSRPAGQGAFTLVATGAGFMPGSVVRFTRRPTGTTAATTTLLATTLVGSELHGAVPAALVQTPGAIVVEVVNPLPGGGTSSGLDFGVCTTSETLVAGFEPQVAGHPMSSVLDAEGWVSVAGTQKVLPDTAAAWQPCLFPTEGAHWAEVSNAGLGPASPAVAPLSGGGFPFIAGTVSEMRLVTVAPCPAGGQLFLNVDWRFTTREGAFGSSGPYNDFARIEVADPGSLAVIATLLQVDTHGPVALQSGNSCPSGVTGTIAANHSGAIRTASIAVPAGYLGRPLLVAVIVGNQGDAEGASSLFVDRMRFSFTPAGTLPTTTFAVLAQTTQGTGNLSLGIQAVPAAATNVFLLISNTPAPAGLGTGSFLGLVPDPLLLLILTRPSTPFDVFHYPTSSSLFALGPLVLPAGTFSSLVGTSFELRAAAYSLAGFFALSPISRLDW